MPLPRIRRRGTARAQPPPIHACRSRDAREGKAHVSMYASTHFAFDLYIYRCYARASKHHLSLSSAQPRLTRLPLCHPPLVPLTTLRRHSHHGYLF